MELRPAPRGDVLVRDLAQQVVGELDRAVLAADHEPLVDRGVQVAGGEQVGEVGGPQGLADDGQDVDGAAAARAERGEAALQEVPDVHRHGCAGRGALRLLTDPQDAAVDEVRERGDDEERVAAGEVPQPAPDLGVDLGAQHGARQLCGGGSRR